MDARRIRLVSTFVGLLALGIVLQPAKAASQAEAASLMAVCRRQCPDDIATCVSTGQRDSRPIVTALRSVAIISIAFAAAGTDGSSGSGEH
jgi:hypothetical protein